MSHIENLHLQIVNKVTVSILSIIIWILIGYSTIKTIYSRWTNKRELGRKLAHIGTGPIVFIAWMTGISRSLALGISIITTLIVIINYRIRLISIIEDIDRKSYGTVIYSISIIILIWLGWPEQSTATVAGLTVMAFGDGFAGLLGSTYSSLSWKVWGQRKSVIGTVTMGFISILVLTSLSTASNIPVSYGKILILSIMPTILEQLTILGFDNLAIPLAISILWQAWIPTFD